MYRFAQPGADAADRAVFPLSHGIPSVDDRRIVSGIVYVSKRGLMWRDAPKGCGPHNTIYNRFIRWSKMGVFNRIFAKLAGEACDGQGRPIILLLTEGQMSAQGAVLLFFSLPGAKALLGDRGYDSDWFRAGLVERGIEACIPPLRHCKVQHHYDEQLYRQCHKIENVFARMKGWRRVATRYDRCAHTFMSAISITIPYEL